MSKQWVVMELSHQGEKRSPQEIKAVIGQALGGGVEVFVPAMTFQRRETKVTIYVMEGYVFVESGLSTDKYFDLEDTTHVRSVLSQDEASGRYLRYVPHEVVEELQEKLQSLVSRSIEPGDRIRIVEGAYSRLTGVIIEVFEDRETATVHVTDLESMEVIIELPFQFLEPLENPDHEATSGVDYQET